MISGHNRSFIEFLSHRAPSSATRKCHQCHKKNRISEATASALCSFKCSLHTCFFHRRPPRQRPPSSGKATRLPSQSYRVFRNFNTTTLSVFTQIPTSFRGCHGAQDQGHHQTSPGRAAASVHGHVLEHASVCGKRVPR